MIKNQEILSPDQFIVIDDEHATLFLCKVIIQRAFPHIAVTTYSNPEKAVEYFKTYFSIQPVKTIVILDINMPQMTGWEVLKEMTLIEPEIKEKLTIVMLSSSIDPKDRQQARNYGMVTGYLEKPLNIETLKNIITHENVQCKNSVSQSA